MFIDSEEKLENMNCPKKLLGWMYQQEHEGYKFLHAENVDGYTPLWEIFMCRGDMVAICDLLQTSQTYMNMIYTSWGAIRKAMKAAGQEV